MALSTEKSAELLKTKYEKYCISIIIITFFCLICLSSTVFMPE